MNQKLKNDPRYYDPLACQSCGSKIDLCAHRYHDDLLCMDCLNRKLNEVTKNLEKRDEFKFVSEN